MKLHEFLDCNFGDDGETVLLEMLDGVDIDQVAGPGKETPLLLEAGSSLHYPDDPDGDSCLKRLLEDAPPEIEKLLIVQN